MVEDRVHREFSVLLLPNLMVHMVTIDQFSRTVFAFGSVSGINQPYDINIRQPPRTQIGRIGDSNKNIRIHLVQAIKDFHQPFCARYQIVAFQLIIFRVVKPLVTGRETFQSQLGHRSRSPSLQLEVADIEMTEQPVKLKIRNPMPRQIKHTVFQSAHILLSGHGHTIRKSLKTISTHSFHHRTRSEDRCRT